MSNIVCPGIEKHSSTIPPAGNPFYPLANPHGTDLKCEVCSKPAFLQCSLCRVTYYCDVEHQKVDWVGIHEKICATIGKLRKPVSFIPTEEERRKKKEEVRTIQVEMVKLTERAGQKHLFLGRPQEAVPAALQCLRFCSDAYGLGSVELVAPYLILAESSISLKRIDQAESYLAQAQWTMLKTQHESTDRIRSALQRKLGLLFAAKGEFQSALEALAQDVYYSSCAFGPSHIRTAGGYYQMADVFYQMHLKEKDLARDISKREATCPKGMINPSATQQVPGTDPCRPMPPALVIKDRHPCEEPPIVTTSPLYMSRVYKTSSVLAKPNEKDRVADDLYGRVVDIWASYLSEIIESRISKTLIADECEAAVAEITKAEEKELDETDAAEAIKMLTSINTYRNHRAVRDGVESIAMASGRPDPKARLALALSMVYWLTDERAKCRQFLEDADVVIQKLEPSKSVFSELKLLKDAIETWGP